jgi:uncharacterized protein YabE (DUF348 family)/3D (Asp-Asp-Asp) domain-containing protein
LAYWLEGAPVRQQAQTYRLRSATPSYIDTSRARLRLALFVCLAFAGFLSFIIFPPQRVSISADGSAYSVVSRDQDVASLLDKTGIEQKMGDVVMQQGSTLTVERAVPVVVEVDGRALGWRTRATSIQAVLDELDIEVSPYDTVFFNGAEVRPQDAFVALQASVQPAPGQQAYPAIASASPTVSITRAVPLTIVEDGLPISVQSSRPTLAMVLRDAGIQLGPADEVYPAPSAEITAGMEVQVKHAKAISLRVGGSTSVIYTHQESLKEALAEAGYALGAEDRVEPSIETAVANGMTARLVRVAGRVFTEKEPIKRKTVFKPDESLAGTATRIEQGRDGVRLREFRVVIEDGVEAERTLIKESFEPEVVDNVIFYAASSIRATGIAPESFTVQKTESMWATWYNAASSGKAATDPSYGITYTGVPVTKGIVAVDPKFIPLGTRLYVPGYGFAVAADTGGGIVGNMIDLGYPDGVPSDWHTGWVDVYVLGH